MIRKMFVNMFNFLSSCCDPCNAVIAPRRPDLGLKQKGNIPQLVSRASTTTFTIM